MSKYQHINLHDYPDLPSIEARRDELLAEGQELTRGDFDEDRFGAIEAELEELRDLRERRASLDRMAASSTTRYDEGSATSFNVTRRDDPFKSEPRTDDDLRRHALAALETVELKPAEADRAASVIDYDATFARHVLAASDPAYASAWTKLVIDPVMGGNRFTDAERTAWQRSMVIGTNTSGGYAVPTHLDPTFLITNDGSDNIIRQLARKVTLTMGDTWNGVSTAGVTASWDPELEEVSDDSPTLDQPTIPVHKAQAFVPFSVEAGQDIPGLQNELGRLFADAKDRLEGAAFATGNGTNKPTGLFTALNANTNVQVTSTTAATIGEVDIHAVYKSLGGRYRRRAAWLTNVLYVLAIRRLGTSSTSSSFTGDLRDAPVERLMGRPVYEADDAPTTQTTTALDNVLVFGDFSNYVVVDRLGMTVELIPHLFGTTNNRPIGARGLYAMWRVGAGSVNDSGFRMLVDKTSA